MITAYLQLKDMAMATYKVLLFWTDSWSLVMFWLEMMVLLESPAHIVTVYNNYYRVLDYNNNIIIIIVTSPVAIYFSVVIR